MLACSDTKMLLQRARLTIERVHLRGCTSESMLLGPTLREVARNVGRVSLAAGKVKSAHLIGMSIKICGLAPGRSAGPPHRLLKSQEVAVVKGLGQWPSVMVGADGTCVVAGLIRHRYGPIKAPALRGADTHAGRRPPFSGNKPTPPFCTSDVDSSGCEPVRAWTMKSNHFAILLKLTFLTH